MQKPVLVVMAAGMGSRYGGRKQLDPVGDDGEVILDFTLYDARRAGFETVVFLIQREAEADFRKTIGGRAARSMEVRYAYQDPGALPDGFSVPEGRRKPWGTAHAVFCCKDAVGGPFAVANSDDFYGCGAFSLLYDYLSGIRDPHSRHYAMAGYTLENTLTENGPVARGICDVSPEGYLTGVRERTGVERRGGHAEYTEDGGHSWSALPRGCTVSMNLWGFSPAIFDAIAAGFPAFLRDAAARDPIGAEYFLPSVVDAQIRNGEADVRVLKTAERWYGMTYRKDRDAVAAALRAEKQRGVYPAHLWRDTR